MDGAITIEVQLFARLRELCGDRSSIEIRVPAGATTLQCFERLCERCAAVAPFRETLAVAVNDEYAGWDRVLQADDVVAFIPPVSGGAELAPPFAAGPRSTARDPGARGARR